MTNLQEIEKLFNLKEEGIISEAEYEEAKARLLNASSSNVTATQAYKDYWKKSFVWQGRATRAEYWWPYLFNMLIGFIVGFVFGVIALLVGKEEVAYLAYTFSLATFFPGIAVFVRRFHDLGKSAVFALTPLWILLGLASLVFISILCSYQGIVIASGIKMALTTLLVLGGISIIVVPIVWLVFLCLPGQKVANKYGDPR